MTLPTDIGKFRVSLYDDDKTGVYGWLGDGDIAYSDNAAGWDQVARPRTRALSHWNGMGARGMSFPFMLTTGVGVSSVAAQVERLEGFCFGTHSELPPTLRVTGPGIRFTDLRYVLASLQWGRATIDDNEVLIRQLGTLTLLEHVAGPVFAPAGSRATPGRPQLFRNYVTKAGDTWFTIAKSQMGSSSYRHLIRNFPANAKAKRRFGMRSRMPKGVVVKIPLRPNP